VPKGGYRANSGLKKGTKFKSTLEKSATRELVRQVVTENLGPMLRAQIAHSQGIGHLFTRDAAGKFSRIVDEEEGLRILSEGTQGTDFWIFMKDPSVQAFTDLMDRALDKAGNSVQEVKITGEAEMIQHLYAGRQHARAKRQRT
jgi:hypothetical protein